MESAPSEAGEARKESSQNRINRMCRLRHQFRSDQNANARIELTGTTQSEQTRKHVDKCLARRNAYTMQAQSTQSTLDPPNREHEA